MIRVLAALLLLSTAASADPLRLAVTTSFENSGLADVLLPALEADAGVEVQLLVVGTGQALRLGEAGDVDAVLVHAPEAEAAFVAAGHATHRREIMFNDFIIAGPPEDPAGIMGAPDVIEALRRIADAEATFVSRGDNSGTHTREVALWSAVGGQPDGRWYRETGSGMGAALNTAAAMGAYVLTDRGSWLNSGNRDGLAALFEGGDALRNQYSLLPVNPARHPHVKIATVAALEAWLTDTTAQTLIDGYRIDGERLFTFNAEPPE